MKKIAFIAISLLLTACNSPSPQAKVLNNDEIPMKPVAKRKVCNMPLDPVCAHFKINGKIVNKTFANACKVSAAAVKPISITKGQCMVFGAY